MVFTLPPHLLDIFYISFSILYTKLLLYIRDKYTYSIPKCNYIY